LVGVVHARVHERLLDAGAIDPPGRVRGVLFDDREDVREQTALGLGELGVLDRCLDRGALQLVDRRP
jgi:hypothetical protein